MKGMDMPTGDLPPITPEKTPKTTRHLLFGMLIGALLVAIGGLAAFFLLNPASQKTDDSSAVSITPTPTPTPTISTSPTSAANPGWKTYTDSELGYSLSYPPEITVTVSSTPKEFGKPGLGAVRFSFVGPDQKEGTELADGLSISLGVFSKAEATTLKMFADQYAVVDENVASKTALKAVTIANLNGLMTTVSGLGTFDYYFLPFGNSNDKAIWITTVSNGSAAQKAKYISDIALILASLKIN